MLWLSSNEGYLRQTYVTIRLLRINLGRVTRIFVITGWGFELVAASDSRNQSVCMLQKHVFYRENVKGWNGHVYALPWGNSKNAQNSTRNFQKCTNLYEELPKMHIIPRGTSKYAQIPTRNFQKCTKSHDWLRIMHKIPWGTSKMYTILWGTLKYAQSYEELPKMHKIPRGTSKTAQNPMKNFQKCSKLHEELPKIHKIP
jgi:hypothetical protein